MFNFRKFISVSAVAILGVTNLLTPLSYANAATGYDVLNDEDLKQRILHFMMPNHDVYLYAHTEANHYFVQYSGTTKTSGSMENSEYIYDLTGSLSGNAYEKLGYTFSGWNTESDNTGTGYVDQADVFNWTAVESGIVKIYAQWKANGYNIIYNLNDTGGTSTAVHSPTPPASLAYDQTGTVSNPTRTGYTFSGWDISDMDSTPHIVGGEESSATGATEVMGTGFKNLRATSGTVNFLAQWIANSDTTYDVEHYLERLIGGYGSAIETDHLSGATDTEVRPAIHSYTGFTADPSDTPSSGNIDADGKTVFKYHYTRNSYNLTLVAGTGIELVSGSGSQNSTGGSTNESTSISFKYDEPVTLSFKVKDGYEGGVWTGYSGTKFSFNMPATGISKIAYATPIVYQLKVNPRGGNGATDRTTYTIEDDDIPLGNLTRDHSTFEGWTGGVNGEGITTPTTGLEVKSGSTGDREYSAVWSCVTGYHIENTGANNESCQPDTNTKYLVNHIQQDLSGNYTIYIDTGYEYGTTNTLTPLTGNNYVGFELSGNINDYKKNIEPDGSTIVNIYYNRLEYVGTIESATGVTNSSAAGDNSGTSPFKYEDTVELSATVEPGYTWSGWTVEDASGNNVTVTDTTPSDPNGATFQMPANGVTITPHVTRDTYTIEYVLYSGHEQSPNPTSYNVESESFTLNTPRRDHSVFLGWTGGVIDGEQLSGTTDPVIITKGSVGNRKYYAVWSCATGYHDVDGTSCVANEYNVEVDHNDGEHGAPDTVVFTYDEWKTVDQPEQSGYDFVGWEISGMSGGVEHYIGTIIVTDSGTTYTGEVGSGFMNLTTVESGTVTFTAIWKAREDTEYVVYHYYRDLNSNTYTLSGTDHLSGETDSTLTFNPDMLKNKSGFTYSSGYATTGTVSRGKTRPTSGDVDSTTIDKYGKTAIYLYYDRNKWRVYLSGDAHVDTLIGSGAYEYGDNVTVEATAKTGYHFKRWEKSDSNRTHSES